MRLKLSTGLLGKENAVSDRGEEERDDAAQQALAAGKGPRQLVILIVIQVGVAAVTIGTLFYPYHRANLGTRAKDAQMLNQLADEFREQHDRWPRRNGGVWELAVSGYLDYKADRQRYQQLYEEFSWNKKTLRFEPKD